MEKLILRVMVLILLGTSVGLAFMTQSKVMLHLPPQPKQAIQKPAPAPDTNPAPTAPTGATGSTGVVALPTAPTGSTGATGAVVAKQPEPPKSAAGNVQDYFIGIDEAKKKFDEKSAIFIDAREFVDYRDGHIAGAMSCPKRRFDGAVPKYIREYLPGNAVVIYCHGAECTDSEAVVKRLMALNLQIGPFYILKDGFPGWQDRNKKDPKGYPINTGDNEGFVQ